MGGCAGNAYRVCIPAPAGSVLLPVRLIQPNALPDAGGQAVRNPGLPCCLGRAVLRVALCWCCHPLADGP